MLGKGLKRPLGQPVSAMWAGLWLEVGEAELAGLEAC